MKKLALLLIVFICSIPFVSSQSCLPDGIIFSTQAQIDNFQINHPNCTEIEGDVEIDGDDITNLNGLSVLTSFGEDLHIKYNNSLPSLSGLDNVTSIGGDLMIENNDALISLTGLDNVSSVEGDLMIKYNDTLISLTGLDNVNPTSINNLFIIGNPLLSTCNVQGICDYLVSPKGSINIYNNATGCNNPPEIADSCGIILPCLPYGNYYFHSQNDIDDFAINYPNCTEIDGDVSIGDWEGDGNDIANLNGLNVLISIGGRLWILDNPVLTSLTGLEGLTSIGGSLLLGHMFSNTNFLLTSMTGLENLSYIGGSLEITRQAALTSLTGLENLNTIEGSLIIGGTSTSWGNGGNPVLKNISALVNLSTVNGNLRFLHNGALTSLSGIDNIISSTIENLILCYNSHLSECEVASVCNYLANPSGIINIYDNANGCSSQSEVEEACDTLSISEISFYNRLLVSPNPFTSATTLSYTLDKPTTITISIFNLQGQLIEQIKREQPKGEQQVQWNAEGLPAGMYYYRIQAGDQVGGGKMVLTR